MIIKYNGKEYEAIYNEQSDYYELELQAPDVGGVYDIDIEYTDNLGTKYEEQAEVQVLVKEKLKIEMNKVFMWIFNYDDFSVKDIVEISDYEINIDEETNATSSINVLKKTSAKARDIIAVKRNNQVIYWGIIDNIQNENGENLYIFFTKYITNLFDRKIILENENLIKTTGIEDFLKKAIDSNYITNSDKFINLSWLQTTVTSHNAKQTSVTNVEDGIYNLHTYLTNCTQNYDIVYSFNIVNKKLVMTMEKSDIDKELIDTNAQAISNYEEVFETDVVSKVVVKTSTQIYTLYLKTDRTTTTNMNDKDRAEGRVETVYTEDYEEAEQTALDVMKGNSYNHNITFNLLDRIIAVGTPIAIKTKESLVFDTYISAITITKESFIKYQCGNIRINFIEKLNKERKN